MTDFALIHDADGESGKGVQWLQSMQEGNFAMPVLNPLQVLDAYNPTVEDELLTPLGEMQDDDMLVFVTVTVPSDVTKMTVNLKGPIIINVNNCKACQVIAEGENCEVKFPIYDILKSRKEVNKMLALSRKKAKPWLSTITSRSPFWKSKVIR